jgi:hypothetical protein
MARFCHITIEHRKVSDDRRPESASMRSSGLVSTSSTPAATFAPCSRGQPIHEVIQSVRLRGCCSRRKTGVVKNSGCWPLFSSGRLHRDSENVLLSATSHYPRMSSVQKSLYCRAFIKTFLPAHQRSLIRREENVPQTSGGRLRPEYACSRVIGSTSHRPNTIDKDRSHQS